MSEIVVDFGYFLMIYIFNGVLFKIILVILKLILLEVVVYICKLKFFYRGNIFLYIINICSIVFILVL